MRIMIAMLMLGLSFRAYAIAEQPTKSIIEEEKETKIIASEAKQIRVTCYTWTGNKTASGIYPCEGMCASNWDHMGDTALLYDLDYNLIGAFIVTDTGSARSLKNGTSIDVYRDTLAGCYEFTESNGDYCYIIWKENEND